MTSKRIANQCFQVENVYHAVLQLQFFNIGEIFAVGILTSKKCVIYCYTGDFFALSYEIMAADAEF